MAITNNVTNSISVILTQLLTLMYCSPGGVPESEVIKLLGNPAAKEPATMMAWATLHRQLKNFIQLLSSETGNRITFYNDVVQKVQTAVQYTKTSL